MKFAVVAEIVAVAVAGVLVFSTVTAYAAPSGRECRSMVDQVKTAIATHPDNQEAREHFQAGSEACSKGFTALGVSQLQAATKALGSQSAQR